MQKLSILGSTGSIGTSALEVVVKYPGRFEIIALAAGRNVSLLADQIRKFRPRHVAVYSEKEKALINELFPNHDINIAFGQEGLTEIAGLLENDIVLNALVGAAGLLASLETIKAGKRLALANKESMVVGGPLFEPILEKSKAIVLPIDSEHSAIWQCLRSGKPQEVKRILLTASGGPFRERDANTFENITREEALAHPTWNMGKKITIDSATMMNKGLELIEAVWLFSLAPDQIKIVIHPQSIVHSMVEYVDNSIIAQMSSPDMKLPITYALFWPDRIFSEYGRINLTEAGRLDFLEPDTDKFPALKLARQAAELGGTAPAVLNAANEVAVEKFLAGQLSFVGISELIERILVKHDVNQTPSLDDILKYDRQTRRIANELIEKIR
jgi:1-deoxy-D-xylulose-5-phosphate reductoisomerase